MSNEPEPVGAIEVVKRLRDKWQSIVDKQPWEHRKLCLPDVENYIAAADQIIKELESLAPSVPSVQPERARRHDSPEDVQRMMETLDSLPDISLEPPDITEEDAERILQACGTSGKEVVNGFIDRLLHENLELKQKLSAQPAESYEQGFENGSALAVASIKDNLGHLTFTYDGREGCRWCAIVKPADGWKKWCKGPHEITLREPLQPATQAPASVPTQSAGWQPIETAPKDGTYVLLGRGIPWSSSSNVCVAFWADESITNNPQWRTDNGFMVDLRVFNLWTPLPAPPVSTSEGE